MSQSSLVYLVGTRRCPLLHYTLHGNCGQPTLRAYHPLTSKPGHRASMLSCSLVTKLAMCIDNGPAANVAIKPKPQRQPESSLQ